MTKIVFTTKINKVKEIVNDYEFAKKLSNETLDNIIKLISND